jgi:hypothetical protein
LFQQQNVHYPSEIILELTNLCNLKCRYCHFHGGDEPKRRTLSHMEERIWKKVLDEIDSWTQPVTLATHGAGEPLLYGQLESVLRRISEIPNVNAGFMTNAMRLDEQNIQLIMENNVKWLALSIDGVNPKTHDYFRVNARLDQIEANVIKLIEAKRRLGTDTPKLHFNMVGYPEILDQLQPYLLKWLPHASQVTLAAFRPIGSRHLWENRAPFVFQPCHLIEKQLVIGVNGEVGLCCEDIHIDVPLGNVLDQSILDIYNNSPKLVGYRSAHQEGKIDNLVLCRDCHVWACDKVTDRLSFTLGDMEIEETITPAYQLYQRKALL